MKKINDDNYNIYRIVILTFIITALWDVVLRILSVYEPIPSINNAMPFIKDLKPYFEKHTLLAAALIAGFVGACTQPIILHFMKFPYKKYSIIEDFTIEYNQSYAVSFNKMNLNALK